MKTIAKNDVKWENYGDVSIEHGQVWIHKDQNEDCYRIVKNVYDYDSETWFIFDLYIDMCDTWIIVEDVEAYCDCSFIDEPILFAIGCTDYYSYVNFGTMINVGTLEEVETYFGGCGIEGAE